MDVSIIIAHRDVNSYGCECGLSVKNNASAQPLGLWATIHSIEMDLMESGLKYEFCIQTNGDTKLHVDTMTIIEHLRISGKLGFHGHSKENMSPPNARQAAADHAKGTYLFFFDNHIMVKPGYFKQAIQSMIDYKMDMLHSTTIFFLDEQPVYHYNMKLDRNFWAEGSHTSRNETIPYRIAAAGHGGFVIKASTFKEVGGYWSGFVGYGGEEIYFDLKMAMLDKTNWIDPKLIHYHYAGNRGYPRHFTDEFYINMMAVANIIGGEKWLNIVYNSFHKRYSKLLTGKTMFDLMDEAQEKSQKHANDLITLRHRDLESQLKYFVDNNIPH